ncbi:PspC domain-containing protein [Gordonia sp. FQ]|uniref:PspC domain-containing protein n=1 Tax=Gordonia sp. FQ TaxID=3446634 RepID=UPI003F855B47
MNPTTLSDFWATRPLRRRSGRKVAGVCAGFGARYQVDPTLVRVAFVVATVFGGAGVLIYLIACVVLPSEHSRGASARERRDTSFRFGSLIPLGILAIVLMATFGGDRTWSGGGLLGTLLLGVGWWLLYQRTPIPPEGTSAATIDPAPPAAAGGSYSWRAADASPSDDDTAKTGAPSSADPNDTGDGTVPPAWDPLGAAPFAWDLPEPTPATAPVSPRGPRSPMTPITMGLAVLVAVGGAAAQLAGAHWFTVGRIASLSLMVIGLGLVVAGFLRRPEGRHASGLIPLGFLAAGIVVVSTLVSASGWSAPRGGVGDRNWSVSDQSELRDDYQLTVGSTTLDLRHLDRIDHDKTVTVKQGVGEIKVLLPENVRVRAQCDVGVGDVHCPPGVTGGGDGPVLTIDAHVGMGNVEMKR